MTNTHHEIESLLDEILAKALLKGWKRDENGGYDGYIEVTPGWGMTLDDLDAILHALGMEISITTHWSS